MKRNYHENFKKYMRFIVEHENYKGLFYEITKDGEIQWVVTKNSEAGKKRTKWWKDKAKELGIEIKKGFYAKVAREIHPTKRHVCQICGSELSIEYVYPSKNLLKRINETFNTSYTHPYIKNNIYELIDKHNSIQDWIEILKIKDQRPSNVNELKEYVKNQLVRKHSKLLSPGVMSNAPDRFDGFHSDNLCCRSESDKGRHATNMRGYTRDRRAYENWAEGDFRLANIIMGEFRKFKERLICPGCNKKKFMTADHIGPISLGFTHRPKFNALCSDCNSTKNNKMSYKDVRLLLQDEKNGEKIISWHSKFIWDRIKNHIKNDEEAEIASTIMRKNMHYVISILSIIHNNHEIDKHKRMRFLGCYLNPKYCYYDYKIKNFHPFKLDNMIITSNSDLLDMKNTKDIIILRNKAFKETNRRCAEGYVRISFDVLREYSYKSNRRHNLNLLNNQENEHLLKDIFSCIDSENHSAAKAKLNKLLDNIALRLFKEFINSIGGIIPDRNS